MTETCESRISNLLASLDNLERDNVNGKIAVLIECIELQGQEIEALRKWIEDAEELKELEKEGQ